MKGRTFRSFCLDTEAIHTIDIIHPEGWASIRLLVDDLDIAEVNVFDVAHKEAMCRQRAEHSWFRIIVRLFDRLKGRHLRSTAPKLMDVDIADLHIFDVVAGNAADDGGQLCVRSVAGNTAHNYT